MRKQAVHGRSVAGFCCGVATGGTPGRCLGLKTHFFAPFRHKKRYVEIPPEIKAVVQYKMSFRCRLVQFGVGNGGRLGKGCGALCLAPHPAPLESAVFCSVCVELNDVYGFVLIFKAFGARKEAVSCRGSSLLLPFAQFRGGEPRRGKGRRRGLEKLPIL